MKKGYLFTFLLILISVSLFCIPVTESQVRRIAQNLSLERNGQISGIANINYLDGDAKTRIYLANLLPQGFVLVSGDDAAHPILGYDFKTKWTEDNLPIQLIDVINNWKLQLKYIVENNLTADNSIRNEWQRYTQNSDSFVPQRNERDVAPLINSVWGQEGHYNDLCPSGVPVGCVATAMAQIMRYWAYPTVGQGTHSYVHPVYGTQSADFGATTYAWSSMPISISTTNTSVATICYHAGVAVDMDYAPDGSGAYSTDVPSALIGYFKYKSTTSHHYKSSYSIATWESMMKGELDNARPVYYDGYGPVGGHAFILDGYTGTSSPYYYHVNWGWYGYYNGYFYLSNLNPGGDTFNTGQAAVIGIQPDEIIPTLVEDFEGSIWPPTGWTVTAPSFEWSSTAPINGSYSARYASGGDTNGKQLRTPLLTIDATSAPIVYKAKSGTTVRSETILTRYSTDGTNWTTLNTQALTATATTYTVPVNGITPGNYYICFQTASTVTSGLLKTYFIDDVTGPMLWVDPNPHASLNLTAWNAGGVTPGNTASSGYTFQLSNSAGGTLTINSVTSLAGTDFTTTFNPGVALVTGQVHEFGFTYEPVNYGTDNLTFVINTNGGTVSIDLSGSAIYNLFEDSFEGYDDFVLSFAPWRQYDGDLGSTWGIDGADFTNSNYTGSYIIFNPNSTVPPLSGWDAHTGVKYAACFDAVTASAPNNDWLISPQFTTSTNATVSFWAKSITDAYGLERFKVRYSTTDTLTTSFTTYLAGSASAYVEAPIEWTYYSYSLPSSTTMYVAIQCVSNDAFAFFVDDFVIHDDATPPPLLLGHLDGYVYEYGTTNPIPNALVTVGTKTAYTNTSGYYKINNLTTGSRTAVCTTPGAFYFSSTVSGISITNGATTAQNFYLTWAELSVSPDSYDVSLYTTQEDDRTLTISNPGGTADLDFAMYLAEDVARRNNIPANVTRREKSMPNTNRVTPVPNVNMDRAPEWLVYADIADVAWFTSQTLERGTYFFPNDFGVYANGITVSKIRHWFHEPSTELWGTDDTFNFVIYDSDAETVLFTSPTLTANRYPTVTEYVLPTPMVFTGPFMVAVRPDPTTGYPHSLGTDPYWGVSYFLDTDTFWYGMSIDLCLDIYADGDRWVTMSDFSSQLDISGTVAPAGAQELNMHFNTTGVSEGTRNANLYVYNNSNYIAPSVRGDVMVVPISMTVTVPTVPFLTINTNTLDTHATAGTPVNTGDVYTISNVGTGTITITSATGLAGTPFTTNFNSSVTLTTGQTHSFGFTYSPLAPGVHSATFTIETNGGTKVIDISAYAVGSDYLAENFEGGTFPPDGWFNLDEDEDGYFWSGFYSSTTGFAHSDSTVAASQSWVDARNRLVLTPDNWLITPRLQVGTSGVIAYWIAALDPNWYAEHYSVYVSTTDNQVTSFTTALFSETMGDAEWHERVIDLTAYAGQSIYIAFRHHACSDMNLIKLDDVVMPPLSTLLPDAEIPQGLIISRANIANQDLLIRWDISDNAQHYKVYVADEIVPFNQYAYLLSTDSLSVTITQAMLTTVGITGEKCFIRVTADNESMVRFYHSFTDRVFNPGTRKLKAPDIRKW